MKNIKNYLISYFTASVLMAGFFMIPMPSAITYAACGEYKGGLTIPEPCDEPYTCEGKSKAECTAQNPIVSWIRFFINLIALVIGVGAVIMVLVAGLQYSASRDNAQSIQAAKQKLINVLIGLAAFVFMYSFIQWLIPGGTF